MHKWIMFVLLSAASLLGVYLLTFGLPPKPVDETAELPPGTVLVKLVANSDFTFSEEEYKVKVGDNVILKLQNKSGIHGAKIEELNIDLTGENLETEFKADKPGEYIVHCSVPCGTGHVEMKTKLIVEAA
ncbi:cytochrome C oxidase subunit II [Paenibacillus sp. NEAU-GSW1]|uniref:cytochrome C oxidase subunit II n=1 Tax=Paenibacillus sp. NEAU-GSW1 TaxID=2682486 RepID=UPI0012E185EF|nr:cytochrome C oxidase subunit II [Paenibacillus sp. NEAU-GSW1]MUT66899.1 cytochrome C oxidase subunit II [Paenibacillus sp. NEAU-GSW1]